MSNQLTVYFGPYLNVEPKEVLTTRSYRACGNSSCQLRIYMSHGAGIKYCPECGSLLLDQQTNPSSYKKHITEEEDFEDELYSIMYSPELEEYLFISNRCTSYTYHIDACGDGGGVVPIQNLDVAKVLEEFQADEKFSYFMKWLTDHDYKFTINYGIVPYYS